MKTTDAQQDSNKINDSVDNKKNDTNKTCAEYMNTVSE